MMGSKTARAMVACRWLGNTRALVMSTMSLWLHRPLALDAIGPGVQHGWTCDSVDGFYGMLGVFHNAWMAANNDPPFMCGNHKCTYA